MASASPDGLKARGGYVRVRAANLWMLPDWVAQQPTQAWLFADEVLVR